MIYEQFVLVFLLSVISHSVMFFAGRYYERKKCRREGKS